MKNIIRKLSVNLIFLFITCIYLVSALSIEESFDEGFFGPKFIPIAISVVMIIAIIFDLVVNIRRDPNLDINEINFKPVVSIIGSTILYVVLFSYIGYVISTIIYVFCLFYSFPDKDLGIYKRAVYSAVITAAFYVLFAVMFQVRLPSSIGVL